MSLLVHAYVRGPAGEMVFLEGPAGSDLAGPEAARAGLYGSPCVVALGARMLPMLATQDVYAETLAELDALDADCALVLSNLGYVSASVGRDPDFVAHRLSNITAAIKRARKAGGAVVIW
ncbi:hypothetical protein [Asanoa iriomotensis]|uniref:Uncharacterized protein n=1 Tax=Asanoa iriomotensis TaxID=234613 RepID=A0ABQ4C742_9ACTN|nr:hypothetical protein [Asanoa iriomotensis]GIF58559.1 hypothetical protein Air01nite_46540 [Asanoa iriomotensis]